MSRIEQLEQRYVIGYRHNPKQFYPNSFRVEPGSRKLLVVGRVKRHVGKNFRVVGVIRRTR